MIPFGKRMMFRKRYAAFGALFGMQAVIIIAMLALFIPTRGIEAQGGAPDATCFSKTECTQEVIEPDPAKRPAVDWVAGEGCSTGLGKCYARSTPIALAVKIGDKPYVLDIGDYIAAVYRYSVGIAAIIAAIMMMVGGFQYLTAGGDASRVSAGKQRIVDALVGLALTLGAFTLLSTINPDLVGLRLPKVEMVKRRAFVGCKNTELCFPCGVQYGVIMLPGTQAPQKCIFDQADATKLGVTAGTRPAGAFGMRVLGIEISSPEVKANVTLDLGKDGVAATCIGRGCFAMNRDSCGDDRFNCALATPNEAIKDPAACPKEAKTSSFAANAGQDRYLCQPCISEGSSCTGTSSNKECCSGFCADHLSGDYCTAGQPGDDCDADNECATGICQTNWGNSCSAGEVGAPCGGDNSECRPGGQPGFCSTEYTNRCTAGLIYNLCDGDSECAEGFHCHEVTGDKNVCLPIGKNDKKECGNFGRNTGCDDANFGIGPGEGYCYDDDAAGDGFCTNGKPGAPCDDEDSECGPVPGKKSQTDRGICVTGMCTTGKNGSRCDHPSDCVEGFCYNNGDYDVCQSGNLGSHCDNNEECNEHTPGVPLKCKSGRCLQGT